MRRWLRRPGVFVLGGILVVVGTMTARAAWESSKELAYAEASRQSDDLLRSIEHYRRALRWSFPLSPHTRRAISGLEECAAELEAGGDPSAALLAWRSLLGGLAATRVPYLPASSAEVHAKTEIARLEAVQARASGTPEPGVARRVAELRRELDVHDAPQPFWGTLLVLGFAVWLVSLESLTRRGFDEDGRLRWTGARVSLWSALCGLIAFAVGLAFA